MALRKAFIFDIDSVLVDPRGYSAAVRATQAYFTRAMGLDDSILVDEHIYTLFEACRVTSEWDMVPIALALVLEEILEAHPEINHVDNLETCIQAVQQMPSKQLPKTIDYRTPIQALGKLSKPGTYAANRVLQLAQANSIGSKASQAHGSLNFPALVKTPILEILLSHTREVERSPTTRLFQQFSLGSQAFTQTYDLPVEIETPSFLFEYDRPLISQKLGEVLSRLYRAGELALCAYTMRPSLPPREARQEANKGYSPEAEMALKLVSLTGIPLIGYGRIHYLAKQTGQPAEKMLKPSPVQAIAAILAALTGNEMISLQTAINIYQDKPSDLQQLALGEELSIHVFEDSAGGIAAMQAAGDLLANCGLKIQVHSHGISDQAEKIAALQSLQIPIFPSTEAAIHAALAAESMLGNPH
jgi:hypothetical protein